MSENIPKKKRVYVRKNKLEQTPTENSDEQPEQVKPEQIQPEQVQPEQVQPEQVQTENRLYPIVIPPIRIVEKDCYMPPKINIKKRIDTPLCPKSNVDSPQWPNIDAISDSNKDVIVEETKVEETNYLYYGIKLCSIISFASLASFAYIYYKRRL